MLPESRLSRFFLVALAWLLVLTAAWMTVSRWVSMPVGFLAQVALEQGAPYWVRSVRLNAGVIEADTRIEVRVPGAASGARGEIMVDARTAHYAYGLPILLALLLAARSRGLWKRAMAGYFLLLPFQAFSLVFDLLKQMAMAGAGGGAVLGIDQWQLEGIGFAYQLGTLVVPTLAPVMLWLWMDRDFFRTVVVEQWKPSHQRPAVSVEPSEGPRA
ncbi:exosortase H-associated membrane protein [Xylophilus sp. ASV27]|uniref:exosortase H-associated membrane protein n=1 Tax=Xylophilus sp. ASV27 TaxID=2795129 RepID=UPI0018EE1EE7|nr:exosortase H-associated membrane protein [Xylophilus sp. ASV27]